MQSVGFQEKHAVVERSHCIRIQMRLPWVGCFVSLTLFSLHVRINLDETLNINIEKSHGN
jgi:hypothetical protein